MKWYFFVLAVLLLFAFVAGCILLRSQNNEIQVTSDTLDSFNPVTVGSVDFYTTNIRVENPTNRTFENIELHVTMMPLTAYCHTQSATFDIPSMVPLEKITETFSFSEFSGLDCAYNFTSSIISENN